MRPFKMIRAFELEISKKKLGNIYYICNVLCLIFSLTLVLIALHNLPDQVAYYFSQGTDRAYGGPRELFARESIQQMTIVLLGGLKYQIWIFILLVGKSYFLFVKKGWSFILNLIITVILMAGVLIYFGGLFQPSGEPILAPIVPRIVMQVFFLSLIVTMLSDVFILPLVFLQSSKVKREVTTDGAKLQ